MQVHSMVTDRCLCKRFGGTSCHMVGNLVIIPNHVVEFFSQRPEPSINAVSIPCSVMRPR